MYSTAVLANSPFLYASFHPPNVSNRKIYSQNNVIQVLSPKQLSLTQLSQQKSPLAVKLSISPTSKNLFLKLLIICITRAYILYFYPV